MAKKQFNATGGLSVGNIISPISVIDANGVINTPANITGNYYFGNGAFLTGINAGNIEGGYGNANVASYLASNSNIDIAIGTGNITTRGNVSANYFIGNGAGLTAVRANGNQFQVQYNKNNLLSTDNQFYYDDANAGALYINYTGGGSLWTDDVISSNSITALGPASIGGNVVSFENFVGNGYYITALEYSNINNAYSNTNAAAYLASNANVIITTTGNITTSANVSANYVIGNGAFLTGLAAGYSNANVADYLASNANINILIGTGNVTTQGNVAANNFVGTAGSNIELIAGSSTWTFDNTGNLTLPSNSVDIYYANGDPINLEGNYSNANAAAYLGIFNGNILAGNLEVSNNAVINGNLTVLGTTTTINANTLNISDKDIVIANGATTQSQANGAGLIIGSNIANILYSDVANAMIFSGNVTTAANIQAGYVLGNGRFLSGLPEAYSNANVAAYLPTYTGNISAGNINATSNISANYFIGNGSQLTDLIATANLTVSNTAPLNATQGDLWIQANTGIQYFYFTTPAGNSQWAEMEAATSFSSGSSSGNGNYGNSNVADFLPTYTGAINSLTGNVTTTANVQGDYILGNGYYLTGISGGGGSYGNANVAAYLASNANVTITTTGAITTNGNLSASIVRAGNIYPVYSNGVLSNNVVDIGSAQYQFRNIYANTIVTPGGISGNTTEIQGSTTGSGIAFVDSGSGALADISAGDSSFTGNVEADGFIQTDLYIQATGNIISGGNVSGTYILGNGAFLTGISSGSGNYSNANVAAYLPTYTGTVGATTVTATGNVTGANINGIIRPTAGSGEAGIIFPANPGGGTGDLASIKYYAVTGQDTVLELQVTDNSADKIYLNASGGTNVATSLNVSGGITGTTINGTTVTGTSFVGNGSALFGIKYANITGAYGNSNVAAYLPDYTGNLNINGLTVSGIANLGPAGNVKISGGNLNYYLTSDGSGGLAWSAGTSNITGNGSVAGADQQIQYNNGTGNFAASAALRFDYTSNTLIVGGNLSVANINATGNIFGINEDQVSIAVMGNEWTFTQDAYLNLPVNFFAVRYANGANVILGDTYSNSSVSNYLGSNSSVTILTTGNVTGSYLFGNGRFLTGINYTNANVAGYLQTYNGNALFGNVTVSQDAVIQGNLTVLGSTNYNNTTNSIIDAYRVIVANSANTISQLNGAGLQIGNLASGNVEFIYDYTANIMTLSHGANIANILNVSGNTSATYFLGNGRFLSGLGENYSNADVSGFLPIYGGNVRADYTISNVTYSGNILPMYSNTTLANSTVDIGSETYFFSNVYGNKFTVPAGAAGNTSAIQSGENYDGFMFVDTVTGQLASLEAGDAYFGNLTIYEDFEIGNDLQVVGNVNCLSNVTAINFIGNGSALFGIQYSNIIGTYSNSNAAAYLPTYTGNLVSLTGNVTTSANIRSNYNIANLTRTGNILPVYSNAVLANNFVDIGSAQYQFRNIYADKLVTPSGVTGNATEIQSSTSGSGIAFIDSGSGQLAAISAGDSSFTGNVEVDGFIQVDQYIQATGNIIAGGNVTGSYILGNGAFLTGINAGNIIGGYGNSQVAAYLQVYNGNASFSNVTVSRDMVVLGNLRVEGNTTEINVSNIFLADKDIIVAANASATLSDLDGAGLQIGNRSAGGNITFFYDSTSNVMELSHGANISNRLEVSGNISGANINGVIRPTAGSGEAGIIFPANPGGGTNDLASIKYYASAGENTVLELNVSNDNADTIYLNASGGTNVATSLTVAGNIVGGNITTTANVSAGNLNVVNIQVDDISIGASALTINSSGDIITTGNLQVVNIEVNDINVGGNALTINTTGDIVTTGNLQVVDIDVTTINLGGNTLTINATGDIVTSGNLQVNNVDVNLINLGLGTITGNNTQVSIASGNRTWIYEDTGNLLLPGSIIPGANSNNTLDIGSSGTQFRRIYANNYVTPVGTSGGPTLIQSNPIGSGIALIDSLTGLPSQIYGNGFITPSGAIGNATLIRNSTTGRGISFVDNNTGLLVPISASESILSGNLTANGYIFGGNLNIGSGALTINISGDIVTTGNLQVNDIDVNDIILGLGTITGNSTSISLTSGSKTWIFNDSGNFIVPGNSLVSGSIYVNGYDVILGGGNLNTVSVINMGGSATINGKSLVDLLLTVDGANILLNPHNGQVVSNANVFVTGNVSSGNVISIGNITGSYILGNGAFLTGISGGSGNYSNSNVAAYLASNANVTILTTANITTAANVQGAYILGNGAFLTGISGGSYGNSNVANYLASNAAVTILTTGNITTTANVSANNIVGSGTNTTITTNGYRWSFNNAGNLVLPGNTFAINYANGTQVAIGGSSSYSNANVKSYLGNFDGNIIPSANVTYDLGSNTNRWNDLYLNNSTVYIGAQEITANESATVFSGNIAANYLLGNGALLTGVASSYGNANVAAYLPTYTGAIDSLGGNVTTTANVTGNFLIGNIRSATGGYNDANVAAYTGALTNLTGNVTTTANVSGAYILGNGYFVSGIQFSNIIGAYSNTNVANYLASNANVTILTTGNITTTANITANNFIGSEVNTSITADAYTWTFNNTGNLVLPSNTFAINYANGTQVSLGGNYSNANVANYLASGSLTSNIITTGNVSGNYILGNGALLTGLPATYSNANVANYLPTYTGNLVSLTGNVTTTGNISGGNILGNIRSAVGGYDNANVSAYLPFYTGNLVSLGGPVITSSNVTANYFFGNGAFLTGIITDINYSNSNVAAYLPTYTGGLPNLTDAVTTTANVQANYFIGNIRTATGGYSNVNAAAYLQIYNANASFSNITVSRDVVIEGNLRVNGNTTTINANSLNVGDKDIIVANSATQISDLDGAGLQLGNLASGNVQFFYNYSGNVMTLSHGLTISNTLTVIGNANISQNLTFNGNLSLSNAGNIIGTSENTQIITNGYVWTFSDLGNLSAPGNVFATYYYGDISNTTGGYGNDEVVTLLGSNSGISIVTSGSIQTTANITGEYYYGNGAFLTGLPAQYSNANVANYLISYPGNIIPAANGAYNLGNNTNRWNDVYVNDSLYLPFQSLTSNSTRIIASSSLSAYDFISTNDITAASNITATGNVTGSYVLGNIRFSTGGYNDANVAAYTGALTNLTGNVTTTANVSGAYLLGNIRSATGGYDDDNVAAYTGALTNLTGNVITSANLQGAYVLGNGAFLTGIAAGYSNADVANYLPTYTGALPNLTGNVITTANVSGAYILGNGYFLSGISGGGGSTYGNANVGDYLASNAAVTVLTTANITTAANVAGTYFIGNGAFLTGISAGSSYGNANVADYLASNAAVTITTTANISSSTNVNAGNFSGTGSSTNIRTGSQLWTFDSTGTLVIPGNINANNYSINNLANPVQDQDAATKTYVDNLASTAISYHEAVLAATTTTLAVATGGTVAYNQVNGVGNGIGATLTTTGSFNLIDTANVQTANTRILVKNEANGAHNGVYVWSNATAITRAPTENTPGVANVDAFGINDYFYTTGGNINKGSAFIVDAPNTAIVFGTSNIQFAVFSQSQVYSANTAAGISLATTTISAKVDNDTTAFDGGGNISVKASANLVTPNIGAATGTSLTVSGNITSSANISGANFVGGSSSNTTIRTGVYNWTFSNTGNLTLASNTFAVNYANGQQVSLGGSYSNADVANYLPTYTGNVSAGNLNLSGNIVDTGAISVITGASGNVSLAPNGTNRVIATTSGANIVGTLDVSGDIIPSANITYSLGSNTSRWNDLYLNNSTIYIGTQEITANAGSTNFSGNVSGTYILGNGAFLTGIAGGGGGTYGNSNVADYLASNAAVTILTTGNITTAANVRAGNFTGSASNTTIKTGNFTWTFDQAGNLNINSASGTIVGSNANTTIQTGANRWNFAADGQLYLPGNIVAGYRDIPQISWTGTPTIALADLGEHYYTASGGVTINIPANSSVALPIGAAVTLINQSGANCTIGANAGVTLYLAGNATTGNRTLAWYGFATLVKVGSDTWFVNGANVI